jgi:hypothetical protein
VRDGDRWVGNLSEPVCLTPKQGVGFQASSQEYDSHGTLRSQGQCGPCTRGYEPSPDTYFASTAPVTHRLAA